MKRLLLFVLSSFVYFAAQAQFQLPNGGFEQWDGNSTSEPTHWNSFASSDGSYASLASSPHHYRRSGGRPGTAGSYFLTIYTKSIVGVKANGNMTTGRIHAGSMSASSSDNYNYTQRSNANFSQPFSGTPDSMYVWVSYYASSSSSQAQVSAYLHGNNDFRSPNDENNASLYSAKAEKRFARTTSSASSRQWTLLKIPFVYTGTATPSYMLVNLTTNAVPGEGSANDSLSVDDIVFVYSAWLTGIDIGEYSIGDFDKGVMDYHLHVDDSSLLDRGEVVAHTEVADATVEVERQRVDDTSVRIEITVTAEDGVTEKVYTVMLTTGASDGSTFLGVNETAQSMSGLKVYPNPAADQLTVECNGEVVLTDLTGRVARRIVSEGRATIDLTDLPKGSYIVRCGNMARSIVKK